MAKRPDNLEALLNGGSESFKRRNAHLRDASPRLADTKPKRDRRHALEQSSPHTQGMVTLPFALHVRILRFIPGGPEQDSDNTSGGFKQLRDAIAALCSRQGDSEKDGFFGWEIITKKGPYEIQIEIYEKEEVT